MLENRLNRNNLEKLLYRACAPGFTPANSISILDQSKTQTSGFLEKQPDDAARSGWNYRHSPGSYVRNHHLLGKLDFPNDFPQNTTSSRCSENRSVTQYTWEMSPPVYAHLWGLCPSYRSVSPRRPVIKKTVNLVESSIFPFYFHGIY